MLAKCRKLWHFRPLPLHLICLSRKQLSNSTNSSTSTDQTDRGRNSETDSQVRILSGAVAILGGTIMMHGLNDYYEHVVLRDMWKVADGHIQTLQLDPVQTGRGFFGREKPRFNATATYVYQDDSGAPHSGTFQSAVSSEGCSRSPLSCFHDVARLTIVRRCSLRSGRRAAPSGSRRRGAGAGAPVRSHALGARDLGRRRAMQVRSSILVSSASKTTNGVENRASNVAGDAEHGVKSMDNLENL